MTDYSVSKAPDGGLWAVLAVVGCFMGNVIGDGVMYSFGVFVPKFKEHFQCGSTETSIVTSIQMGVTFASGPVASYLTNKLGWRLTTVIGSVIGGAGLMLSAVAPSVYFLYFSAGVLIGLGLGIIYLPRLDCITQYWDKKRPFVTGIAICGSGIGTFIFAPLTDWLLSTTNWQTALLILGGICHSNCIFALLFKPLPKYKYATEMTEVCESEPLQVVENEENNLTTKDDITKEAGTMKEMIMLLRNWVFMMFAVSNFLTSLGYPIPYAFVPDNAKHLGLHPTQGSFLVGLIGISNTGARFILGIISQKLNRLFLYNTCLVICGVSMALTNYFHPMLMLLTGTTIEQCSTIATQSWACDPYIGQLIYAILYGITSAAYVLLTTLVLADLLGADKFTNAFGLLLLFQGVATFIGPPIVGMMFDSQEPKSYNPGFILMGIMIALSGLMLYPIPFLQGKLKKERVTEEDSDTKVSYVEYK